MKFESKLGIGEVCIYNDNSTSPLGSRRDKYPDCLVKVVAVHFEIGATEPQYTIELPTTTGAIQMLRVNGGSLVGDGDFDQDAGCYPDRGEDGVFSEFLVE